MHIPKVTKHLRDLGGKIPGFRSHMRKMQDVFFPLHEPGRLFGSYSAQYVMYDVLKEKGYYEKEEVCEM